MKTLLSIAFVLLSLLTAQAANLARWQGTTLIIEDGGLRFHINRAAGGQLDYLYNKARGIQYLKGNGYYYLAGTGADSFAANFYQSYDYASNLSIYENTSSRVIVEVAGYLKRPPAPHSNNASSNVAYLRRYTYSRDTNSILVNHAIRFDADVSLSYLSTTLDCDEAAGCRNFRWAPTQYYIGAGNSWTRKSGSGSTIAGAIDRPAGFTHFANLGRMYIPGLGELGSNRGAIVTDNDKGSITRAFDSLDPFQSFVFWTNTADLRARSLEAHFLNRDSTYIRRREGGPFQIRRGTVYRATERLVVGN